MKRIISRIMLTVLSLVVAVPVIVILIYMLRFGALPSCEGLAYQLRVYGTQQMTELERVFESSRARTGKLMTPEEVQTCRKARGMEASYHDEQFLTAIEVDRIAKQRQHAGWEKRSLRVLCEDAYIKKGRQIKRDLVNLRADQLQKSFFGQQLSAPVICAVGGLHVLVNGTEQSPIIETILGQS